MVLEPLGPGQHRVVVGGDHDRSTVDAADPADQAVGGGAGDQVLDVAAAALGGDGQRGELDEAVGVTEVGDVLPAWCAGRSAAGGRRRRDGRDPGRWRAEPPRRPGRPVPRRLRRRLRPRSAATAPGSRVTSTSPARTASPTATRSSTTVPSISAATTCSIFIDSMTTSVVPAVTPVPAATGTPTTRPCRGDTTACTRSTLTTGPGPPVAVDRPVAGGGPVGQAGRRR